MTRSEIARMFLGCGVELGVAAGDFSVEILANHWVTRLWSIDRWSDHHDEAEYLRAGQRLAVFGERSVIVRGDFRAALPFFADGSLDFAYLDAYAHQGQCGGRLLDDWWPKLKPGGILAGHDYAPQYQPTIDAVDIFVARHGLTLFLTYADQLPSWYVFKPCAPQS